MKQTAEQMKCFKMHYLIKVNKKNQWMYNIVLFSALFNTEQSKTNL
jgi:hypothetical protein